jgi:pimeloyl-ACP methyl ester carboxylesterase
MIHACGFAGSEPGTTASAHAAGSVGATETRYLDLPRPLPLDCGRELHPVCVAYETYGTLAPGRDNVILVCHALSGDAYAAGFSQEAAEQSTRDGFGADDRDGETGKGLGWWDGMIGPGKAFDTGRFFVISTKLLGGCRGTTGPSSPDPATGKPYGSSFPVITVADMVRTERALLDELGIERLAAVAGGSLGGMQAFEWAISYPNQVDAIVAIASTQCDLSDDERFLGSGQEPGQLLLVAVTVYGQLIDQSVELGCARGAYAAHRLSRSGINPSRRASSWISSGSVRASNGVPFTVTIQANGFCSRMARRFSSGSYQESPRRERIRADLFAIVLCTTPTCSASLSARTYGGWDLSKRKFIEPTV